MASFSAEDFSKEFGQDECPNVGEKCEIRVWQQKYKKDGTQEIVKKDGLRPEHSEDDEPYALVATRIFDTKNVLEKTQLVVNSPRLLQIFRNMIGSYPTVPSDFETAVEMESPFRMLYHYWHEIDDLRHSTDDDITRMHLNLLFGFMKAEMGLDKARCDAMIRKNQISFAQLWTIYRPGDLLYTSEDGHGWLLKCKKTAYEETKSMGRFLEVHCTFTDYDGTAVGQATHIMYVNQKKKFAAENPAVITDLPIFPLQYLKGRDGLEDKLSERGRRYLSLQGVSVKSYNSLAKYLKDPPMDFYDPDMGDWPGVWLPYMETGRVIIDRKTFQEENHLEQVEIQSGAEGLITPLLCPPYAYGYSLARKDWCRFLVDEIDEPPWKENAFESLVLKENQKLVLAALTEAHAFPENARDQTSHKGKGLVILLHGSPGSGKTLTAESAAEITKKALLSTTMGELNKENRAWMFEYRLKKVLQYATIWKAVVLLDEADVFLEARRDGGGDSTERNALVAVFLRHLEYFSGILFLTSNRVGTFDQAMKSRIHLALEYSPPEIGMRRVIWRQYLSSVPPEESQLDIEDVLDTLVRDKMNGREISNTVHTARTIARYKKEGLQMHHIDTVLQVRRDFEAALIRIKKVESSESRGDPLMGVVRRNSLLTNIDESERPS